MAVKYVNASSKWNTAISFEGGGAERAQEANTPTKARVVRVEAKPGLSW